MKTSSIRHPENNRYIQVHEWQIQFCHGNHCAALLLGFFSGWHDWKLKNDEYYFKANNIAELHGDERNHYAEKAYLFFSTKELVEGTLGFYGKDTINDALDLLISLNVISVHQNPNPRYHFDKTKYYQFYPNVCNEWVSDNFVSNKHQEINQDTDFTDERKFANPLSENPSLDCRKIVNRSRENRLSSTKNRKPSTENRRYITNTTNNTTNHIQSIQLPNKKFSNEKPHNEASEESAEGTQQIIEALITLGMSPERFTYPDVISSIEVLLEKGATLEIFSRAFDISVQYKGKRFGVRYLLKVVESELQRGNFPTNKQIVAGQKKQPVYESDFSNGMEWAGDIANMKPGV